MHRHRALIAGSSLAALAALCMSAEADDPTVGAGAAGPQPEVGPLEEYGSFTLQMNHLVTEYQGGDKTVLSVVNSTETADEALFSQIRYFGDAELLFSRRLRDELQVAEEKDVVIVYQTPRNNLTNIIVDAPVFSRFLADDTLGGSVLSTHASLLGLGRDMVRAERQRCEEENAAGRHTHPSRVLFYVLDSDAGPHVDTSSI